MAVIQVVFNWSDEKGQCYDCGRPAAYSGSIDQLLCSVCAARAASLGEQITYLFEED